MNTSSWIERVEPALAVRIDNRARILKLTVREGSGVACAYCNKPIGSDSVEHEVEAFVLASPRLLHFHRICQHLWESGTT
jgi:hypothetical protein